MMRDRIADREMHHVNAPRFIVLPPQRRFRRARRRQKCMRTSSSATRPVEVPEHFLSQVRKSRESQRADDEVRDRAPNIARLPNSVERHIWDWRIARWEKTGPLERPVRTLERPVALCDERAS